MKVRTLREARARLSTVIEQANEERVLITSNGKPAAIVVGVKGQDLEEVMLTSNPRFWQMIEESRGSDRTLSAAQVRERIADRLKAEGQASKRPKRARRTASRSAATPRKPVSR